MDTTLIARGGTPINLDKRRILFFDMNATWMLIQQYGRNFITKLYRAELVVDEPARGNKKAITHVNVELVSMEALAFFLLVGLLYDAKANGEELTLEQVQSFITPYTVNRILDVLVLAVMRTQLAPDLPGTEGKAEAAAARPAAAAKGPGPTKVSTSSKRSASRTRSSSRRRKPSTRKR